MAGIAGQEAFLSDLAASLEQPQTAAENLNLVLGKVLDHFGCTTGTIHSLEPQSGLLRLEAHRGMPESLLPRVAAIPIGKGMAGIAAERRQPVQVCNLQTDNSGVAKPAAKDTRMEGSIAIPMLVGASLRGVLGVAKPVAYEFTSSETAFLQKIADVIGKSLGLDPDPGAPP